MQRVTMGLAALTVACWTGMAAAGQKPSTSGSIAAVVNGEPVMRTEIARLLAAPAERRHLLQQAGDSSGNHDLERLALQTLIRRRLILQEAARRHFTIKDEDVDNAVTALRRRFTDLQGLGTWMREQGLDERSLFATIRAELLAARVRQALVGGVVLTHEHATEYFDAHRDELKIEQVRLQLIIVKDEPGAQQIMSALAKGGNFHELARRHSVGVRARRGGDAGWHDVHALAPPLRETVVSMEPRQARGPIRRGDEFLIVRVEDRRTYKPTTIDEARGEIERRLVPVRQREALEAWLAEQQKVSRIEMFPDAE